jgi:hypothetical protein
MRHREGSDAGLSNAPALHRINIPQPDQDDVPRIDLRSIAEDLRQFPRALADTTGQRHPVHIPARARIRRIHVGMRINPDDADSLLPLFPSLCNSGHGTGRHRMITAQNKRKALVENSAVNHICEGAADGSNLIQVLGARGTRRRALGLLHKHIAKVLNRVAERSNMRPQSGEPHGRRPHINAAPARAQVKRHTENGDA